MAQKALKEPKRMDVNDVNKNSKRRLQMYQGYL